MTDQKPGPPIPASGSRRPIVVLLVDDQRFVGAAVGQLLASEPDIDLHFCDQALEAIAMANTIAPTMVLQDLIMPGVDGLTLVRLFRENPLTAGTPVIVLSGNDDAATRARALAEGAADYLVKLPAKADLVACIRRHAPREPGRDVTIDPRMIAAFHEAGSPDFTRRVIEQFIAEAESLVRAMSAAAASGDRAVLTAAAHSLKGSSGIMGAQRLAALCVQVETQLAESTGRPVTPALMMDIDQELGRVRDALAREQQETIADEDR
jgi:DNA-binding response OmpR family regulator